MSSTFFFVFLLATLGKIHPSPCAQNIESSDNALQLTFATPSQCNPQKCTPSHSSRTSLPTILSAPSPSDGYWKTFPTGCTITPESYQLGGCAVIEVLQHLKPSTQQWTETVCRKGKQEEILVSH